MKLDNFLLC